MNRYWEAGLTKDVILGVFSRQGIEVEEEAMASLYTALKARLVEISKNNRDINKISKEFMRLVQVPDGLDALFASCVVKKRTGNEHNYDSVTLSGKAEFSRFMLECPRQCGAFKIVKPIQLKTPSLDAHPHEQAVSSINNRAGWSLLAARNAKPFLASLISHLGSDVLVENRYLIEPSESYLQFFKTLSVFIKGQGLVQEIFDQHKQQLVKEVGKMVAVNIELRTTFKNLFPVDTDVTFIALLLHTITQKVLKSAVKDFLNLNNIVPNKQSMALRTEVSARESQKRASALPSVSTTLDVLAGTSTAVPSSTPPAIPVESAPKRKKTTFCLDTCVSHSVENMVGCDGPDCGTEWYHLTCLKLNMSDLPANEWICPDCIQRSG